MPMEYDFHFDLLGSKATLFEGMFFVDKLDCNDRFRSVVWYGLSDSMTLDSDGYSETPGDAWYLRRIGALPNCLADKPEG